jgi:predicted nucleic acid-binding protein
VTVAVTFDVNVLVGAVARGNASFWSWPSPPPTGADPAAECVGIINDAEEFALWLSPHILTNLARVLADATSGFGWPPSRVEEYVGVLVDMAAASGGGLIEPSEHVVDCVADWEDNRVLELALASNSLLIVSSDRHLLEMSPWRGIPVIHPRDFVGRVDAMRRSARRER